MSVPEPIASLQTLPLAEGLARLAGARPPTVLCASARQAQALHAEYAELQQQRGVVAWSTPEILGFDAAIADWYQRVQPKLLLEGRALPPQLGEAEALLLWELCVSESEGSALLRSDEAARLAAEAWQLCTEYRLSLPFADDGSADIARFKSWAQQYRRRLERLGVVDAAGFDQALLQLLRGGELPLPDSCLLYGFESYSPRLQQWLQALAACGVELLALQDAPRCAVTQVQGFAEAEQELRAAAAWMRDAALREPAARLAVIIPDLSARRASVQRVFDEQLCPQVDAPAAHAVTRPYNLTLGEPLAQRSLVQTALRLLQLAAGGLDAGVASALLLSPYWGAVDAQCVKRAALDAELRRQGHLQITPEVLAQHGDAALRPYWRACIELRHAQRQSQRLGPAEWGERFAAMLTACDWPGPRALDSDDYQLLQRWRELLLSFAQLQRVLGRVSLSAALAQLRALAERAVYQPQSPATLLQVLGVLEAQGLRFDAIRVIGLDDEHWPAPARAHPFIPHAVQRRHQLPHASAAQEMAYAQAQLAGWQRSCTQLTLSYSRQSEGHELAASPLLVPYLMTAAATSLVAQQHSGADAISLISPIWEASLRSGRCEELADAYAPAPRPELVLSGGARVLGDQARCAFRGYALHRLGIRPLQTAAYGLQAYDRGNLVHRVLERLWALWQTQAQLLALGEADAAAQLQQAIVAELDRLQGEAPQRLPPVLRELEAQRLQELLLQWLEVERARPAFRVLRIENREISSGETLAAVSEFAGLQLRLRPDRIDVDDLGRRIVLDYKTGALPKLPWSDARPEDPQLLLYALIEPQVAALAYARLSVGDLGLHGIAADDAAGLPAYSADRSTRDAASWQALQARWRGELETVAAEIRKGWAAVLPKHPRQSCRDCGLHALCRIRDEVSLDEGEEVAT